MLPTVPYCFEATAQASSFMLLRRASRTCVGLVLSKRESKAARIFSDACEILPPAAWAPNTPRRLEITASAEVCTDEGTFAKSLRGAPDASTSCSWPSAPFTICTPPSGNGLSAGQSWAPRSARRTAPSGNGLPAGQSWAPRSARRTAPSGNGLPAGQSLAPRSARRTPPSGNGLSAGHSWAPRSARRTAPSGNGLPAGQSLAPRSARRTPPSGNGLSAGHSWAPRSARRTPPSGTGLPAGHSLARALLEPETCFSPDIKLLSARSGFDPLATPLRSLRKFCSKFALNPRLCNTLGSISLALLVGTWAPTWLYRFWSVVCRLIEFIRSPCSYSVDYPSNSTAVVLRR
ncbi:hypothetical protein PseBG33_5137 [Pseudomonas synxantha BG33R]|nr:hypothetical protein PseBG33_5137 [Pseudomonas synxantha BG33R]